MTKLRTVSEEEKAESSQWLAAELARLQGVHSAAKAFLESHKSLSGASVDALREKIHAVDLAAWRAARPAALVHMSAWALARPRGDDDEVGSELRAWVEEGHAIVTDGTALLAVKGEHVAEQRRPKTVEPFKKLLADIDWTSPPCTAQYDELVDMLEATLNDDLLIQIGVARFHPYLIDRLLPRLLDDAVLDVFCSPHERAMMALRPHGSDAWTLLVMPRADSDGGYTLELRPPV